LAMYTFSATQYIEVTQDDKVATISFNRPEVMNALHLDMLKELSLALKELSACEDIQIVILKGNGNAFCSGGDIKSMIFGIKDEKDFFEVMDAINEVSLALYALPKLTISSIHGAAAGLGLSLALASDYIVAQSNSKVAMNFIGIGLIPDGGGHFHLQRKLGETKAKQVIWGGEVLSAKTAYEIGMIEEVVELVEEAVERLTDKWLNKPVQAMIRSKTIMAEANRPALIKFLELEKTGQSLMRQTQDHQEGIKAFVEKRKPVFIGK
jgi:2-(1,2-epoxy-1,2-dihydrophenyl)acetyl-CoA isomerase